jgi:hypothetical protein
MRGRASKATRRNRCPTEHRAGWHAAYLSCRLNDGLTTSRLPLVPAEQAENSSFPLRRNGISFHVLEAIQNKVGQNVSRRNLQKERATEFMRNGCSVVPAHAVRDGSMQVTESRRSPCLLSTDAPSVREPGRCLQARQSLQLAAPAIQTRAPD